MFAPVSMSIVVQSKPPPSYERRSSRDSPRGKRSTDATRRGGWAAVPASGAGSARASSDGFCFPKLTAGSPGRGII
ncbi:hypothetical protein NL676_038524 [Syzygium grande]|nr:hypothetical protein NL676_038524 [Syzygium grande]